MARRNSKSRKAPADGDIAVSAPDEALAPDAVTQQEPEIDAASTARADAESRKRARAENIYDPKYDAELSRVFTSVEGAFQDKNDQDLNIARYWKVYNCELTPNQMYQGTSQVYLPIVHNAIEACVQRDIGTLFPETGRYTSVLSNVPNDIHAIAGLLDHYVRRAGLRSKVRELLRNGYVEGQMSIYVEWEETTRFVTKKVMKHPETSPGMYDPNETFPDVEDETITDARPNIHLISAPDLAVIPPTFSDIEIDGEVVAIKRRYTADALRKAVDDGLFDEELAAPFLEQMEGEAPTGQVDQRKAKLDSVGISWKAGVPCLLAYEVWAKFEVDGKRRWCKTYFADTNIVLGMYVNPNWNDRCSVMSKALTKIDGAGWGKSSVDAVEQLQYQANDWANMAGDNGMYSLLPIVMTDPEKNPMLATMVMNLAAVWQTSPKDTQILEFPQLWKDALEFVAACESRVMQGYNLNPAMVSTGTGSKKQTQADVSQDQAVAIASATDEALTLEEDLLSPLLQRFFELDQQHRDDDIAIKIYGQMGIEAKMEAVPPFAWTDRYEIGWRGTQAFRSMQMIQQMTAGMNILRSLPPVLPNGKRIDLTPIIQEFVDVLYGPRLGAQVLVDKRSEMTIPQAIENQMMAGGIQAMVHPEDNDPQHMQETLAFIQATGDPAGLGRLHFAAHQQQMQQKAMMQQQMQMQAMGGEGLPGSPGGAGQPGIAGTPRPGAQPGAPRGGQNPPGMQHQDQVQDPSRMPRPQRVQ